MLGIDYNDTQPEQALELARRRGVTYPLLADPGATSNSRPVPQLRGLPILVLVDADGKVVHQGSWSSSRSASSTDLVERAPRGGAVSPESARLAASRSARRPATITADDLTRVRAARGLRRPATARC